MAIDHHMVTAPGEVVGATGPGQSETREGHNSTSSEALARLVSRRNLLRGAAGAGALVLALGGGYLATRGEDEPTKPTNPTAGQRGPETRPVFEKELTLNQMKLPETLDAPTFAAVTANVGEALQYAVNTNNAELIRRLIPGGNLHVLQPGQFELRAVFIKGYRESSQPGTMNYNPNDPDNVMYYPWGFKLEMLEQINHQKDQPTDEDVDSFVASVRVHMGDLPQLTTRDTSDARLEITKPFEAEAVFTRVGKLNKDGTPSFLPDVDGTGRGWGIANISKMYPIPEIMSRQHEVFGFEDVPDLYKKSAL